MNLSKEVTCECQLDARNCLFSFPVELEPCWEPGSGITGFLESLPLSYVVGDYFFVHAGVDPERPLGQQSEKALMTIREPFLRNAHRLPVTVVHGHVVNLKGPVVATRRICVDTGAYATGVLTAVALTPFSPGERAPVRFLATLPG